MDTKFFEIRDTDMDTKFLEDHDTDTKIFEIGKIYNFNLFPLMDA